MWIPLMLLCLTVQAAAPDDVRNVGVGDSIVETVHGCDPIIDSAALGWPLITPRLHSRQYRFKLHQSLKGTCVVLRMCCGDGYLVVHGGDLEKVLIDCAVLPARRAVIVLKPAPVERDLLIEVCAVEPDDGGLFSLSVSGLPNEAASTAWAARAVQPARFARWSKQMAKRSGDAASLIRRAEFAISSGRLECASEALNEARSLGSGSGKEPTPFEARALADLGLVEDEKGHFARAAALYREAIERAREVSIPQGRPLVILTGLLGRALMDAGDLDGAEATLGAAMSSVGGDAAGNDPFAITVMEDLGAVRMAKGRLRDGARLFKRASEASERMMGSDHPKTITALQNAAAALYSLRRDADAWVIGQELVERLERTQWLEGSQADVGTLLLVGAIAVRMGRLPEAEEFARRALGAAEERVPHDQVVLAAAHNLKGIVAWREGHSEEAVCSYRRVLGSMEKRIPAWDERRCVVVRNLAKALVDLGEYESARSELSAILQSQRAKFGAESLFVATTLADLGKVELKRGDLDEAERAIGKSLAIKRGFLGEQNLDTLEVMEMRVGLLVEAGRFAEALTEGDRLLELESMAGGESAPGRLSALNDIALATGGVGDFARARACYEAVLRLCGGTGRFEREMQKAAMIGLAETYGWLGDVRKAARMARDLVDFCEKTWGPRDERVADALELLGGIRETIGEDETASKLLGRALEIREANEEGSWRRRDWLRVRLALVLVRLGRVAEGNRMVGEMSKGVECGFMVSMVLGRIRMLEGDFGGAVGRLEDALRGCERDVGVASEVGAMILSELGGALQHSGRVAEAVAVVRRCLAVRRELIRRELGGMSGMERFWVTGRMRRDLDGLLSVGIVGSADHSSEYAEICFWKGVVARYSLGERDAVVDGKESRENYRLKSELARVAADISNCVIGGRAQMDVVKRIEMLRERREEGERKLGERLRRTAGLGMDTAGMVSSVRASLGVQDVLVDYVVWHDGDCGRNRVTAFVVRREGAIRRVELGSAGEIDLLIEYHRKNLEDRGTGIREKIWDPIEPFVKGAKQVFICPDEGIALLPFETLPGRTPGSCLIEDYSFVYLEAPTELLEIDRPRKEGKGILLVGGLDYDGTSPATRLLALAPKAAASGSMRAPETYRTAQLRSFDQHFGPLEHSLEEVRGLAQLYAEGFPKSKEHVTLLTGEQGTEEQVKRDVAGKRYVHLATHGFFAPELNRSLVDVAREQEEDLVLQTTTFQHRWLQGYLPGLLSGIVLSGANLPLGKGRENGLLTSGEAAWLDLSSCELVTLSACDTGLGVPSRGEHLIGLRRALRLAGARTRVTSLWKVDDRAASELMRDFYHRLWIGHESKIDALRDAQLAMLRKNRGRDGHPHPETWGAFVLEGDWR